MHASHIAGMMASLGARALGPAQSPAACARVPGCGCGVLVRGGRCRDAREGVAGAPRLLRSRKTSRAELVAFRVFRRENLSYDINICVCAAAKRILSSLPLRLSLVSERTKSTGRHGAGSAIREPSTERILTTTLYEVTVRSRAVSVSALHRPRATLFYDVDTDDDSASSATARTCRPCAPSRCAGSGWCRR